ncbi:4-hydroxybenzoyl-CoA thioesterase [Sulfurifustis variabilis]|uniref:4-hydroxybenzoyl-CoA thioesterase n=1 Tax=Sulfurifustis variabilis TaxID=1675686 RepID=A0A1B4VBN5_9GAMM|nr:tol-pal system-associated acyl-CoA thioesterase [Sulfurifustis variabilis]BAU49864.1 4-hydroxybenzoyl-CoA thioesterase [Sulfurifustis variabilis]
MEDDKALNFAIPVRIYYEDTDAGGVVYYANYLRYMERARTEWLRALGFEQDRLIANEGVIFAVRSARLEFVKPARFNDVLNVGVRVAARGGASLTFAQTIVREGATVCEGEVRVACLDAKTFAPRALPAALAQRLEEST